MDHQSLYRKYRPQVFEDVLGQEHVTRTLQNALKRLQEDDREFGFAQAYLFCGPRGTGKTTTARILAKALNCAQGPTPQPCGQCDSCIDIARGSAMDVLEIDAASNTGVDNVREVIISKVNFKPALGHYRMYIIDEAHQLSNHAFNALLKTIEEPPPHAVFVLATTEFQKVPATIQSRCQRFIFHHLTHNDIAERLKHVAKHEAVQVEGDAVYALAHAADGALRDALTLLEQMIAYSGAHITADHVHATLGTLSRDELQELLLKIERGEAAAALEQTRALIFRGLTAASLARAMAQYVRDRVVDDLAAKTTAHQPQRLQVMELFARAESDMRWNASQDLMLELAVLKASAVSTGAPLAPPVAQPTIANPPPPPRASKEVSASPPFPRREAMKTPAAGTPIIADDNLANAWSQLLERVKKQGGAGLEACLREGTPVGIEREALLVTFPASHDFHRKEVVKESKRKVIESVLREMSHLFPGGTRLECRSAEAAGDELVDEAMSIFGAKIVE